MTRPSDPRRLEGSPLSGQHIKKYTLESSFCSFKVDLAYLYFDYDWDGGER